MTTTGNQFLDLCDAVKSYYGSGSDQWLEIAKYGANADQFVDIVKQVPGVNVSLAKSGRVLGYTVDKSVSYQSALPDIAQQINSNAQAGGYMANSAQLQIPAATGVNQTTGAAEAASGMSRSYESGQLLPSGAKQFVTGSVLPAVLAASAGIAAGKKISQFIYDVGNFFDLPVMEEFNPETWNTITQDYDGPGWVKGAFNMIFGLDPESGTMQPYAEDTAIAYMMGFLAQAGFFDKAATGHTQNVITTGFLNSPSIMIAAQPLSIITNPVGYGGTDYAGGWHFTYTGITGSAQVYGVLYNNTNIAYTKFMLLAESSFQITMYIDGRGSFTYWSTGPERNGAGENYYFWEENIPKETGDNVNSFNTTYNRERMNGDIWHILKNAGIVEDEAVPGVEDLPGGTTPDISTWSQPGTTVNDILQSLQTQYPDWWNNRLENDVIQPDGTVETIKYIPIPMPDGMFSSDENPDSELQPTSSGDTVTQLQPFIIVDPTSDEDAATDTLLQTIIDIITQLVPEGMADPETSPAADQDNPLNPDTNPPDTGEGNTPVVVTPTGSASALWTVYNPTQAQVDQFGAWLWSSSFIDQVKKLFADPMQGIIGIHKIFVTPATSGSGTIVCGYLDSNVPSNIVGSQYVEADCGTVFLPEYFGNVLDYEQTELYIYLPFIGIQRLDVSQCMRGVIGVKYKVDVYTGACLAEISVARDNSGGVLYTYSGDCAVRYPISSGSYMGVVSGILTTVGAVAGGIITGNPLLAGMGAISGIGSMKTDVQHSGNLSGNSGAMGGKKPYLIIKRPQTAYTAFAELQGYGANSAVNIGSLSGFVRFSDIKIDIGNATEEEKQELVTLCKNGIYI